MSTIENADNNLLHLCEPVLTRTLLFGSNSFDTDANTNVLNTTIEYIISTKQGRRSRLKTGAAECSKEKQSHVVALYKQLGVWDFI